MDTSEDVAPAKQIEAAEAAVAAVTGEADDGVVEGSASPSDGAWRSSRAHGSRRHVRHRRARPLLGADQADRAHHRRRPPRHGQVRARAELRSRRRQAARRERAARARRPAHQPRDGRRAARRAHRRRPLLQRPQRHQPRVYREQDAHERAGARRRPGGERVRGHAVPDRGRQLDHVGAAGFDGAPVEAPVRRQGHRRSSSSSSTISS
jgi:hypothetical protein